MKRERSNTKDSIEILLKLMEWDKLTDGELDLLHSYEIQFKAKNWLSDAQFNILNEIFDRANAR